MIKKHGDTLKQIRDNRSSYIMMLPFMIFFLLFTVITMPQALIRIVCKPL